MATIQLSPEGSRAYLKHARRLVGHEWKLLTKDEITAILDEDIPIPQLGWLKPDRTG